METTHESFLDNGLPAERPVAAVASPLPARQSWYCEKPLDSVRRFCGKTCADSFDEEAEYTR